MRGAILCLVLVAACGKVNTFTDGGAIDGHGIDGKAGGPDAMPFVCDQQTCGAQDQCCPSTCNANNDPDCAATCGNGVIEPGETCDPLATCVTSCPQIGCTLQTLQGAGTCAAQCVSAGQQGQCVSGDGCCPVGCNSLNDAECAASCDNGVIEA